MMIGQEPKDTDWEVAIFTSIGFVIEENKDHIVLARDIIKGDVRGTIVIPRENIINNIKK